MTILEQYIDCMQKRDGTALVGLFNEYKVLRDSSATKVGMDTIRLEGKMAVGMMLHHRFELNGEPFLIHNVKYTDADAVWYFITYYEHMVPMTAPLLEVDDEGKIKWPNIHPLQ